jgi:inosine-uridine nucleoside N-ribohydrolase
MRRLLTVLLLVLLGTGLASGQHRVWIDTDIASGKLNGDMDDALALVMLLRDTSVQIAGISVVHGLTHAEKTVRRLLRWYAPGRDIAVHRGATSYRQLGERTDATTAIERALTEGSLTIMALGPATNLATVFESRPDLTAKVNAISFCGGRRPGMVFSPGGKARFSDYNFDLDTASGRMLMTQGLPMTLAGYDCSDSLFISRQDYAHLQSSRHRGDRWMYRKLRRWEGFWRTFVGTDRGFIPFDCATVGVMLHPEFFLVDDSSTVHVHWSENDTRNTVKGAFKNYLLAVDDTDGVKVSYCHHALPAFKQKLLGALHATAP